jgi:Ca-activated chloride channel family protein
MNPSEPIVIPEYDCTAYLTSCCPVPPSLYGPKPASAGCTLEHWLLPDACVLPPPGPLWPTLLGRWERRSVPLMVSAQAGASLAEFLPYMKDAEESTGDAGLGQEVKLLKKLISRSGAGADD